MHGGVKVYRGAPAAARIYVEADRSRADDYYLAEGTGIAEHLSVDREGRVVELEPLSGDAYEAWVAGLDPDTGEPRGRLRADGHAVRFVEVVVNGPKSWSLAAELHPDVAAAYEVAQGRAARQIVAWLGQHATTRVGPRGAQVAVPVEKLDATVIRHYTSRSGDPHRHLHLQVNARVFAAGKWRGLDTVAFRDSIAAINGIGHAAVACDPAFRTTLAADGYTLTPCGEITQLAEYVGPFSKRATQIGTLLDRYETEWRTEHPGQEPGSALRRAWDARAWAENRPDKVIPRDGCKLHARWLDELHTLGYRDHGQSIQLPLPLPGGIDRDAAAAEVLARLGAGRSAWNAADVRGGVEQLLSRVGVVAEAGVRTELAEDVTARALRLCVALREGAPEHVRALTSQHVLDVEADLATRLAARGGHEPRPGEPVTGEGLDVGQRAAVAVLAGDAPLVLIEGAAGAGKTTTLAAVRDALDRQGRRLLVVTPTRKAAQVASAQIGAHAGSAAWLAYQHGWRWDESGTWTRLDPGAVDPVTGRPHEGPNEAARLRTGDVLLVDEAGMLDQDTAHALLTIADETGARIALVGDRHQLPAVGRGGVLELACRSAHPDARVDLDVIHRFTKVVDGVTVPDEDYAALSLAMRAGGDPGAVFDALLARGQVVLHRGDAERDDAISDAVAADRAGVTPSNAGVTPDPAGVTPAGDGDIPRRSGAAGGCVVVVDTREQAAVLNAAIHDRLVQVGAVHEQRTGTGRDGQPIGVGDRVVTRRNDTGLGVANREAWTVTRVHRDGRLAVSADGHGDRELPAGYVREHVELGYAVTAYGAQGATTATAHFVLTEQTTAASAYVAMTRGRHANAVHLVAESADDAREQWVAAFSRDRADHGPDAARHAAEQAVAGYSPAPAPASPEELAAALDRLPPAWDVQAAAHAALEVIGQRVEALQRLAEQWSHSQALLAPLVERMTTTSEAAARATTTAQASSTVLADTARAYRDEQERAWYADRPAAQQAVRTIAEGSGRLGLHRGRVRDARADLDAWAAQWPDVITGEHADLDRLANPYSWYALDAAARAVFEQRAQHQAAAEHPDAPGLLAAAETANAAAAAARRVFFDAQDRLVREGTMPAHNPTRHLAGQIAQLHAAQRRADHADAQVAALSTDPAITSQPDPDALVIQTRRRWQSERNAKTARRLDTLRHAARADRERLARLPEPVAYQPAPQHHGPSIGR